MLARLTFCAILAAVTLSSPARAESPAEPVNVAEDASSVEPTTIPESLIPTVPEEGSDDQ